MTEEIDQVSADYQRYVDACSEIVNNDSGTYAIVRLNGSEELIILIHDTNAYTDNCEIIGTDDKVENLIGFCEFNNFKYLIDDKIK